MAPVTIRRGPAARLGAVLGAAACLVMGLPATAPAATVTVSIRDNLFTPQEVRIDPGDTVTWTNGGRRFHDVTSDTGDFASGDLGPGAGFSHTFEKEGYYYYHCSFHGRAGRQGMWGVVVVGDPPPPGSGGGGEDKRPRIDVPGDFATIQAAVDAAEPGSTIVIAPGRYKGDVRIATDDLVVRGVDRFRTIVDGDGARPNGFVVEGAARVTVANLTVRDFTSSGISFLSARRFTVDRVDAIGNRSFGVLARGSYDGVVRRSFGWGSGDSAFAVSDCMGCGVLIDDVYAAMSYLGYSGTDATGVTVRGSTWTRNGAGLASLSTATGKLAPGRGTMIVGNLVQANDYVTAPASGSSGTVAIPMGTGVWLAGVENNVVRGNVVLDHARYGVVVTQAAGGYPASGSSVVGNRVRRAGTYALAWDGAGSDNCFADNDHDGETGPPDVETLYPCSARPFQGTPYGPVQEDVARALVESQEREPGVPDDPRRPRCQKGRPGCHRH